jgi:hypothetical protein
MDVPLFLLAILLCVVFRFRVCDYHFVTYNMKVKIQHRKLYYIREISECGCSDTVALYTHHVYSCALLLQFPIGMCGVTNGIYANMRNTWFLARKGK